MRLLVFVFSIFLAESAFAIGVTPPFVTGSTTTLPKGIRGVRFSGITGEFINRYSETGFAEPIAAPFNQTLSYSRLLKAEKDQKLKDDVAALLQAKGVSLDSPAGQSTAQINSRATVMSPILAYGVTDKWTLAITAPVVYTNISIATGFVGTQQLSTLVESFNQKSAAKTALVEAKLNDVISTELSSKGYEPLTSQENTEVGDLSLFSRVNVYSGRNLSVTLGQFVTAPTGRQFNENRVVDPAPGDGQWDLGTSITLNYKLLGDKITLYSDTQARWQLAHRRAMRVPFNVDERLSADVDLNTFRDLGDIYQTALGSFFQLNNWLGAAAGYQVAYKERDFYRGSLVADIERYNAMGVETEQVMQAGMWQLNASSIQAFKANKFPVPLVWSVTFSRVFQGRNIRTDDMWSTDLAIFF